ncbi:hypothetical protein SLE2022_209490 [Rubroshorea leprosula]
MVILEYIEEVWPQTPLLPQDPHQRALARFWMKVGEDESTAFFKFFKTVGEEQERATEEARELLKILEARALGGRKFFNGHKIGLIDIAFGWIACWLDVLEEAVGVKLLDADNLPK